MRRTMQTLVAIKKVQETLNKRMIRMKKLIFSVILFSLCLTYYVSFRYFDTTLSHIPLIKLHSIQDVDWTNFEIYVRLTSRSDFKEQLENWLFKSMELFFPRHLASTILVFDSEKQADRDYATQLMSSHDTFNLRICYMDPVPNDVIHNWGKERMYFDMMHADYCKKRGFVGFVDVDTLFVTAVTQDLLFENGKPIVTGRIGIPRIPCWIDTAEYVLGLKQVMQCMSYFPVVFNVEHIVEMRKYVEKLHGKSFQEVFKIAPAAVKVSSTCFCHYSIMCNYMWYFHRDSYAWHLQTVPLGKYTGQGAIPSMVNATYFEKEVLPSEKIPIPRSSIHARHFMLDGKYKDGVAASLSYTNTQLREGFCFSFGHSLCPEKCKEFDSEKLQDNLFAFENYRWQWDKRCMETQVKHYNLVKAFLYKHPHGFITDVGNRTVVCNILQSLT